MKNALPLLLILLFTTMACKSPEARRPINQKSASYIDNSIERNKKLIAQEEEAIQKIIAADTSSTYLASKNGFWYTYEVQDTLAIQTPMVGDLVSFNYDLKTLAGTPILTEDRLGNQTYQIDQSNQDLISGLREGLKLMKEGEVITLLLPSHKAYGYYGLDNEIGSNVALRTTIRLHKIQTKTED